MKRILLTLLFISIAVPLIADNSPETIFDSANRLYQDEDYQSALNMYMRLYNDGYHLQEIMYNVGNCEVRLNNLGKSLIWYKRAKYLSPRDEQIKKNITFIEKTRMDRIGTNDRNIISKIFDGLNDSTTLDEKIMTFTVFYVLFFMFAVLLSLIDKYRSYILHNFIMVGIIIFMILMCFTGIDAFMSFKSFKERRQAVIVTPKIDVRSAPLLNEKIIFTLHDGSEVEIIREENDWVLIRLPDGTSGWIKNTTLERI